MRKSKQKLIEIINDVYSKKEMNDFCPYVFECKGGDVNYNWQCFGRYKQCDTYIKNKQLDKK